MQELFFYDRDKGLFKNILNKSSIMGGRYHVSPFKGADLNTNNLESYLNDPANGLVAAKQKYPLCVCFPPKGRVIKYNGVPWDELTFTLFFVCPTYVTGDNQIKSRNVDTNTSSHYIWYDWQDMKECALNFFKMLKGQESRTISYFGRDVTLRTIMHFEDGSVGYSKVTEMGNDRISGVGCTFIIQTDASQCVLSDYVGISPDDITMPPAIIHALHQQ